MKFYTLVVLFLISSCATSPNRVGTKQEHKEILDIENRDLDLVTVYLFRKFGSHWGGKSFDFLVNDKLIVNLTNSTFSRTLLPPGKHNFEYKGTGVLRDKSFKKELDFNKGDVVIISYDLMESYYEVKRVTQKDITETLEDMTYLIPNVNESEILAQKRDDLELWSHLKKNNSIIAMDNFIKKYPRSAFVIPANKRISKLKAIEKQNLQNAKQSNNFSKLYTYLKNHPDAHNKEEAFKAIVRTTNKTSDFKKLYYLDKKSGNYFPEKQYNIFTLMDLGPDKMKIKDIVKIYKTGISSEILSAKILASNARYSNFTFSQIGYLKKKKLTDQIISSMIKVTTNVNERIKRELQNKEQLKKITELIENSQKAVTADVIKEDNGNTPIECIKQQAAMKACSIAGGFLQMACEQSAKLKFNCPL